MPFCMLAHQSVWGGVRARLPACVEETHTHTHTQLANIRHSDKLDFGSRALVKTHTCIRYLRSSRIVWKLLAPLSGALGLSTLLCFYETALRDGLLPSDFPT